MTNYNDINEGDMTIQPLYFYECDNPACQLRFPRSPGQPRWNRCPVCRSSTHLVAVAQGGDAADHSTIQERDGQFVGMLDNIRSAWNVGSIFRTADGTGIRKLFLCGFTPSPDGAKVSKTALGAEITIPWERANNGLQLAIQLKASGHQSWAVEDLPGAQSLFAVEIGASTPPVVLIVGNELAGIDPGILALCDKTIAIPMLGKKRSYNVAVAFGIAAGFLLYRQSVSQGSRSTLPST